MIWNDDDDADYDDDHDDAGDMFAPTGLNLPSCRKVLHNLSRWRKVLLNLLSCRKVLHNRSRWRKVLHNLSRWKEKRRSTTQRSATMMLNHLLLEAEATMTNATVLHSPQRRKHPEK